MVKTANIDYVYKMSIQQMALNRISLLCHYEELNIIFLHLHMSPDRWVDSINKSNSVHEGNLIFALTSTTLHSFIYSNLSTQDDLWSDVASYNPEITFLRKCAGIICINLPRIINFILVLN